MCYTFRAMNEEIVLTLQMVIETFLHSECSTTVEKFCDHCMHYWWYHYSSMGVRIGLS